jgi:hypothetical protein
MINQDQLMNDLQSQVKELMERLCGTEEFSERMEVTLYDLIPNLDEIGLRRLIGRLQVINKSK